MAGMSAASRQIGVVAAIVAALVRRDSGLYLLIVAYTLAGSIFLYSIGAIDRAAYSIYFGKWPTAIVMLMLFAVVIDLFLVVRRFDSRRRLVIGKVFSAPRLAYSISGLCLLMALMVFQGTFTSVKNGLAVWHSGFPYDVTQADIDAFLHFGVDPWRWLYAIAEYDFVRNFIELNYNVFWFILNFGAMFFVATSPRVAAMRTRYLLGVMLVWIIVGNVLAGMFLSAGPAFYGAITGDTARFGEQLAFLARGAHSPNSAATYQGYLWGLQQAGKTGFASGISAFPSIHVAMATLNALFLREYSRRLGNLAFLYVAFIILSPVYLAWHYAIDGYAGAAIGALIYVVLRRLIPADHAYRRLQLPGRFTTKIGGLPPEVTAS
jgi:membrane-associated phospholipid phosphatase